MDESRFTRTQIQIAIWASIIALLTAAWIAAPPYSPYQEPPQRRCQCFPGDACWPSAADWDRFNQTLNGRLLATVPLASPCHDTGFPGATFNAEACAEIRESWGRPELHAETAHSPMAAFFANQSCDPFTPRDAPCVVIGGAYAPYAVNASGAADYREAIAFARARDLRLVIRNTGHDYSGKSTGAGVLVLWTRHIRDIAIISDYHGGPGAAYAGKAMRVGTGVQAAEAQKAANARGLVVVEGDCPTVGIAGGYAQGGGTSPLASRFGLAADQVLEWEVVTADGELLTASPSRNSDLYWALTGGGGGTYGVVLSMTIKLHENKPTAGATLSFSEQSNDAFWGVIRVFLMNLPAVLAAGTTIFWMLLPGNVFMMPQSYLLGGAAEDLDILLQPTLKALEHSGIPYEYSSRDYPNFQGSYHAMNPEMNIMELNLGGRLIPRSLVASDASATTLTDAIGSIVNKGAVFAGVSMDTSRLPTSSNSVHPAWRDTLFLAVFGIPYDRHNMTANLVGQQRVTYELGPILEALTPGGASYLNEADFNQPNWQEAFYGVNYARLLSIKPKYDPEGVFWGKTAVGSEGWDVAADGRLCMTIA